jgi:hypothetical protein
MVTDDYWRWVSRSTIVSRRWEPQLRGTLFELCALVGPDGYFQVTVGEVARRRQRSVRQMQRILRDLNERGLLKIVINESGRHFGNSYRLLADFVRETFSTGFANLPRLHRWINPDGSCIDSDPACQACQARARAAPT